MLAQLLLALCGVVSTPSYEAVALAETTCVVCTDCHWDWAVRDMDCTGDPTANFTWVNTTTRLCFTPPGGTPEAPLCTKYQLGPCYEGLSCSYGNMRTSIWACPDPDPGELIVIEWE